MSCHFKGFLISSRKVYKLWLYSLEWKTCILGKYFCVVTVMAPSLSVSRVNRSALAHALGPLVNFKMFFWLFPWLPEYWVERKGCFILCGIFSYVCFEHGDMEISRRLLKCLQGKETGTKPLWRNMTPKHLGNLCNFLTFSFGQCLNHLPPIWTSWSFFLMPKMMFYRSRHVTLKLFSFWQWEILFCSNIIWYCHVLISFHMLF